VIGERFDHGTPGPTAGGDGPVGDEAMATLSRLAFLPGWIAVGAATLPFALGASVPLGYQLLPLAASVVLLGLPHGAVDHLAIPRVRAESVTPRALVAVGGLYLAVGGAYAAVWFLAPAVAAVFFILLTWAHWGQGDVYPLVAFGDGYPAGRPVRLLTAATRGALPMVVPFVASPGQYELVVATLVELFDPGAVGTVSTAFTPTARLTAAVGLGCLIVATLAVGFFTAGADGRRSWLLDAGETGLLVWFFSTVPPILAVGLYFCVWHSLRHIVRLLAVDPGAASALESGRYLPALASFGRDAAPLTAASIVVLGLWYPAVPGTVAEPLSLVGAYLALIAVLTLPHVVVVSLMDRAQGIWTPR
jgi:Brp/Blh family beta-carotene 15,15'-monooxygenase